MLTLNEKTKNKLAINNFSIKLDIESAENGGKYKTQGIWQRLTNFFFSKSTRVTPRVWVRVCFRALPRIKIACYS